MLQVTGTRHDRSSEDPRERAAIAPIDESRLAMMRRVKRMTVEQRLDLFETLSRDAAWARGAKRVR